MLHEDFYSDLDVTVMFLKWWAANLKSFFVHYYRKYTEDYGLWVSAKKKFGCVEADHRIWLRNKH